MSPTSGTIILPHAAFSSYNNAMPFPISLFLLLHAGNPFSTQQPEKSLQKVSQTMFISYQRLLKTLGIKSNLLVLVVSSTWSTLSTSPSISSFYITWTYSSHTGHLFVPQSQWALCNPESHVQVFLQPQAIMLLYLAEVLFSFRWRLKSHLLFILWNHEFLLFPMDYNQ